MDQSPSLCFSLLYLFWPLCFPTIVHAVMDWVSLIYFSLTGNIFTRILFTAVLSIYNVWQESWLVCTAISFRENIACPLNELISDYGPFQNAPRNGTFLQHLPSSNALCLSMSECVCILMRMDMGSGEDREHWVNADHIIWSGCISHFPVRGRWHTIKMHRTSKSALPQILIRLLVCLPNTDIKKSFSVQ